MSAGGAARRGADRGERGRGSADAGKPPGAPAGLNSGTNQVMRLKDKVVIVTGSTMGIGEATARRCVAEGAKVVIHGLEADRGRKIVADLGERAVLHISDLSDAKAPAALASVAVQAFGGID